jgi:hypothetical protein
MRRDESAPPVGAARDDTRQQRNLEAVIAQYIQDLARAA